MIYGSDWGSYLSATSEEAIPFNDLHAAGLLDFFITKGDQEVPYISSVKNIQWARTAGVEVVGSYYWHFPVWSAQYQIDLYSKAIEREKPDFIAFDMEDTQGKSSWAVSENARFVCEGLRKNFPDKKLFIYTSANYININAPDCNKWIGNYDRWIASWPDYGVKRTAAERYLSFAEIKGYPKPNWLPALPSAWVGKPIQIWQFGTWQIPEGYGWPFDHQYDWNVYNGTLDDFKILCGLKPAPILTDKEKLDILWSEHLKG
jgi:hypothetical protein